MNSNKIESPNNGFFDLNSWVHTVVTISSSGTYVVYKDGEVFSDADSLDEAGNVYAMANITGGSVPPSVTRNSNFIGKSNQIQDSNFVGTVAYVRMWEVIETQTGFHDKAGLYLAAVH